MAEVVDFLVGPTASGKTQVGVLVAEALGAEVISLDSMAVYRGMDIGTAKPSPEERERVPLHLIDVCEPTEEFSAGDYLRLAATAVTEIRARGRRVLFVGGTPMYPMSSPFSFSAARRLSPYRKILAPEALASRRRRSV